ncbi:MAG TPA: CehA/McbA family metallohydrolase [Verrucomicrobiae bacterium]
MRITLFSTIGLALALSFGAQRSAAATRLEARVIDEATGLASAARVAITNAQGRFVEIEGRHDHVEYLGKRWCYVDGSFAVKVPGPGAGIEVRRGFETRPLWFKLPGDGKAQRLEQIFRLSRWSDLRQQGYVNGDIHAHLPIPREAHLQMRAEDLNALTLLHMADSQYYLPVNKYFTGKLDANSTPGCEIYVGQEIRDFQMGHLTLLNLTSLVAGYPDMGGGLEYWRMCPHWDLVPAMRAAREQNGMVVWSHVCSLPGEQLPIGIALGLVDGMELVTWNDPTQFPNHWEPWETSGMSQAEFPVMRALDLYYQFLNAGFRVPIAAGTDKFGEEIPLGSNRVFAQAGQPASYATWLAAIKAGKTFVSNGPILEFEVEGHRPGDVVEFKDCRRVKAQVTARSILPFTTLEIVFNGETIGHKTMPVYSNAPVQGVYSMKIETTLEVTRSGWLAARVVDHPDLKNRILPRELSVFAHTSPVYFLRDGSRVRDPASIAYLTKYVEGVIHWLGTRPKFTKEEDLRAARQEAEEALAVYRRL